IAVEEGNGELRFLQPVIVGGLAEGRNGKRQHDDDAAGPQGERFGNRLDKVPSPPTGDVEPVHEVGKSFVKLAPPCLDLVESKVDAGIEIERKAVQPGFPTAALLVMVEGVAQGSLSANPSVGRAFPSSRSSAFTRKTSSKLWQDNHTVNVNR